MSLGSYVGQYFTDTFDEIRLLQPITTDSGSGTSRTCTLGKTATAGSTLIASWQYSSGNAADVTTPSGWTREVEYETSSSIVVFSKEADGSETDLTITAVAGTSTMALQEWAGLDSSDFLDVFDVQPVTATSLNFVDGITTTTERSLVMAILAAPSSVTAWGNTWTDGLHKQAQPSFTTEIAARIRTSAGAQTTTETWTTSRAVRGLLMSLKAAVEVQVQAIAPPVSAQVI